MTYQITVPISASRNKIGYDLSVTCHAPIRIILIICRGIKILISLRGTNSILRDITMMSS